MIKVRIKDDIIFGTQKEPFDLGTEYYEVDYSYNFPLFQSFYFYKWDKDLLEVVENLDEHSIDIENRKKTSDLQIVKYVDDEKMHHKSFDFTLVLMKDEPLYYRGEKKQQNYLDPDDEKMMVKKHYIEIIGDRLIYGETSSNRILGLKVLIEWLNFDGSVGSTKVIKVKKFNRQEEGERNLLKRGRQITNLKGMAMGTAAEPVVDAIYSHYDEPIRFYINQGTSVFYDALAIHQEDLGSKGETRFVAIGMDCIGQILVVIYTPKR